MKEVTLTEIQNNLLGYLERAGDEEIVIMHEGKPAGIVIGIKSEDDWFDYCLERDPRFLRRIDSARKSLRAGGGVRLEDVEL